MSEPVRCGKGKTSYTFRESNYDSSDRPVHSLPTELCQLQNFPLMSGTFRQRNSNIMREIVPGLMDYKYYMRQRIPAKSYKTADFEVRKSVHHHTIQINQTTRCNGFTSLLLDVYVWLNMFRVLLRPSSGAYNCTRSL